jgi:hypothetical protein
MVDNMAQSEPVVAEMMVLRLQASWLFLEHEVLRVLHSIRLRNFGLAAHIRAASDTLSLRSAQRIQRFAGFPSTRKLKR